jgi:ribosomal protein S18 acetylase RimI-like enzyme
VIRPATLADRDVLRSLWEDFQAELAAPPYMNEPWERAWQDIEKDIGSDDGLVILAEEDGAAIGHAIAEVDDENASRVHLWDLYLREGSRGRGLGQQLLLEVTRWARERGATHVTLDVMVSNDRARHLYERLGFEIIEHLMAADLARLEHRLEATPGGRSFGSAHVQTDDSAAVERAAQKILPRLGRTAGTRVEGPRGGWVAVYDELCDREPEQLQRLARELSYATGAVVLAIGVEQAAVVRYALYDRGGVVDEYLSVPEFFGPLPPGDVVALGANPRVVARLTGADPNRIRELARNASSPDELLPPEQLVTEIAAAMGVAGAEHGWVGSDA